MGLTRCRFYVLGEPGTPYPAAIRALRRRSGVYIIRDRATREVLYVGESHSARLYATMTRHFQSWADPHGSHGRPHLWHHAYPRNTVEVAFRAVPAPNACAWEEWYIARLQPRDNNRAVQLAPF